MSSNTNYIGNELELFSHAHNWKRYWISKIAPYLGKNVLEVGAGIGTNTKFLLENVPSIEKLICLEPDHDLASKITGSLKRDQRSKVEVYKDYLTNFTSQTKFDSILYIDVIEHIKDDSKELEIAKKYLKEDGNLIILVPAHNFLYSKFDKAIGHYRRYNRIMLKTSIGKNLLIKKLMYLDAFGMFTSIINKLVLKQDYPKISQIKFWDRVIVRLSKIVDPLFMYRAGKSLLLIAQNNVSKK